MVRPDAGGSTGNADDLLIVDCLLPGQVRKLGRNFTYLTARRAIKTSARDCEIRGGEYVAYDRANFATALKTWLPLAEQGDPEAQTYAGEIYERGLGTRPDYEAAALWYRKAAEQGYQRAEINLGHLYEAGLGVPKDVVTAMNWYRRASGLGKANLEFVSDAELANRQAQAREVQTLRQEVGTLRQELASAQRDLRQRRQEVQRQQRQTEDIRKQLQQRMEQPSPSRDDASLRQLQEELKQREQAIQQQQANIARLEAQTNDYRTQLSDLGKTAKSAQGRTAQLEESLRQRSEEADALRQQLSQAQRDLSMQEQAAASAQREVDQSRAELEQLRQAGSTNKGRLAELERQLAERQQRVDKQQAEIAKLQSQSSEYREKLAALQSGPAPQSAPSPTAVGTAGPTIELIDPPLLATRGAAPTIRTRSGIDRVVVGKVDAPAGLLAFTVNDQEQKVGSNGLFRTSIPVQRSATPVRLVAVDRQGKRAAVEFQFAPEAQPSATVSAGTSAGTAETSTAPPLPPIDFGKYYALVIGNDDYRSLPHLATPVNDAEKVAQLLRDRYGFKTTVLKNATRYDILSAMNQLREKLTEKDNLLIYYAGHGELDRVNQRGYWLPVDAEPNNNANWISNVDITDMLNAMSAKEVMVVADSCYSGALTRSALARLEAGMSQQARYNWIKVMSEKRSRTVLTSGGLKPVLDSGAGNHSVFAKAFIDVLSDNQDIMEGQRLSREVSARVTYSAAALRIEQVPEYAPIKYAGHEAGDFFFVPRRT